MIITKEVEIKIPEKLTSEYIEKELKAKGYDVLRWAITGYKENYYILSIAIVINDNAKKN